MFLLRNKLSKLGLWLQAQYCSLYTVSVHRSVVELTEQSASCSVMSNSSRPHGLQPIRLFRPWDSPGKNPGVGCHFLLQTEKRAKRKGVKGNGDKNNRKGDFLMVQWLILCTPKAGEAGFHPWSEHQTPRVTANRSHAITKDPVCCSYDLAQTSKQIDVSKK